MKYIIISAMLHDTPRYFGFVFSERWAHSDFAEAIERMIALERTGSNTNWVRTYKSITVLSAGFCTIHRGLYNVVEHGSESLKIAKDSEQMGRDEGILNMPEAMQGMYTV